MFEGGYFQASMSFPTDYPNNPPIFKFKTQMWHPNSITNLTKSVYPDGRVCISILHAPGTD